MSEQSEWAAAAKQYLRELLEANRIEVWEDLTMHDALCPEWRRAEHLIELCGYTVRQFLDDVASR